MKRALLLTIMLLPLLSGCAVQRETYLRGHITDIGREMFPENSENTWQALEFRHAGELTYVEAVPDPQDVGYERFIFVMSYAAADAPAEVAGVYCLDNGQYTLLCSAPGWDDKLPRACTGQLSAGD